MNNLSKKNEESQLINKLPAMLYRCRYDEYWTMEFLSDGCKNLTGYDNDDLLLNKKLSFSEIIHKDDLEWTAKIANNALLEKKEFNCEYRIITKDNIIKWVWEQGVGIYDENDTLQFIEGFITDVTSQKELSETLKEELIQKDKELLANLTLVNEYKKAVDESAIVTKTTPGGIITFVNDEFCRISGYSREEVLGKSHNIVRHPQNPNSLFIDLWETIQSKTIWKGVIKNRTKSLITYYVKTTIVPILDSDDNIKEFIAIRHDVTDLILQEKKIKFQTTDLMTQLPNRQKVMEDLNKSDHLKLAIINIEKFKEINEYYGFDIGDRLLVELSTLLSQELFQYQAKLYKLPADEFAILVNDSVTSIEFREMLLYLLTKIRTNIFEIEEHKFTIRAIAGASMQKNYFIHAEMAANYAKESNQNLVFFDDNVDIKDKLVNNIKWTHKIKKAIEENRIIVFAQPIVSNTSHAISKYECLVRMIDEDGTIITPFHFLSIAKHSRLYPKITKIVINKAIEYFKNKTDSFSINLNIEDILNQNIVNFLMNKLEENRDIAKRLIIEIVEDEGIENFDEVSVFIENIKNMGCKIAIDDFGTGYSNFDYLMRLNVDFIKIDGSIIKNIDHDYNAKVVTELIVSFAKRLKIETIGEFVYKEEILEILKVMGVDYSQGYHLGKPEQLSL
ncbi:EAL domain-containing protein [Arcobacter sp. 15-2]|uniref:bifunctional diguanylate cyclase/phosphodiesterase n=1 Tax=Arcobacter sp. 15-2 TaxID=3374109 RepID=UPI00399C97AD